MQIAIVGAHRGTRRQAPFNDPSWTIWSSSPRNIDLPRIDLWFEIHHPSTFPACGPEYIEWMKRQPSMLMQEAYPEYPGARAYPKDEMLELFGPFGASLFSSTTAFQLALAITKSPKKIGLWGIEQ